MPTSFAVKHKCCPMAAELMISVMIALLMASMLSNSLQAQGRGAYENAGLAAKPGGVPAGVTYATTALNWTQTISRSLTGKAKVSITLTPCPAGIDTTSGAGYQVLLSGGGNSEAVNVVTAAGGCTSGAASGTITFTPRSE